VSDSALPRVATNEIKMKKYIVSLFAFLVLAGALSLPAKTTKPILFETAAGHFVTPVDETPEQVAWEAFQAYGEEHGLIAAYRKNDDGTYDLAYFDPEEAQKTGAPKWAVYGYTDIPEAVKQLLADVEKYPMGHETHKPNA